MGFRIPGEVRELGNYLHEAYTQLQLQAATALTAEELQQFKRDYPTLPRFWGVVYTANNADEYKRFVPLILDYFILKVPGDIFGLLEKMDASTAYLSAFSQINTMLDQSGANALARYLGPARVPHFVDDPIIFKKMLWLEWFLQQTLQLVTQGIVVDFSVPLVGGPRAQLQKRLEGTQLFVAEYEKNYPESSVLISRFRATYDVGTVPESFLLAMRTMAPAYRMQPIDIEVEDEMHADDEAKVEHTELDGGENDVAPPPEASGIVFSKAEIEFHPSSDAPPTENNNLASEQSIDSSVAVIVRTDSPTEEKSHEEIEEKIAADNSDSDDDEFFDCDEISQAVLDKIELPDKRAMVLKTIMDWVNQSSHVKSKMLFNVKHDIERANDLIKLCWQADSLPALTKTLAKFITTGRTASDDKNYATYSRIDVKESLIYALVSAYYPDGLTRLKRGLLGRPVISATSAEVEKALQFKPDVALKRPFNPS